MILAINKIKALKRTKVIKVSRKFITDPVGGPAGQGKFLNAAIKVKTNLSPFIFLKQLKKIEAELGRKKNVLNGPRTIDLDILFYGERSINTGVLTVPHPRLFFRNFVLKPLSEII
jgi:2-amino-4-hydroxy-6-hydroxymethyldihydropteridine diphosphokinase